MSQLADDVEPIIGASVLVEGSQGAITMDGKFVINNVPTDAKALIVSLSGHDYQRVGIQRGIITAQWVYYKVLMKWL